MTKPKPCRYEHALGDSEQLRRCRAAALLGVVAAFSSQEAP